jgi:hypothetical protein
MEITQMASVHPKIPLQDSMLKLTGTRLPGVSIPREEQSETEFRTRNVLRNVSIKIRNNNLYMKYGVIKSL